MDRVECLVPGLLCASPHKSANFLLVPWADRMVQERTREYIIVWRTFEVRPHLLCRIHVGGAIQVRRIGRKEGDDAEKLQSEVMRMSDASNTSAEDSQWTQRYVQEASAPRSPRSHIDLRLAGAGNTFQMRLEARDQKKPGTRITHEDRDADDTIGIDWKRSANDFDL